MKMCYNLYPIYKNKNKASVDSLTFLIVAMIDNISIPEVANEQM